ncbi:hypothetical protein IC229_12465 [Spirosoma sp. BT702]|uniref:Uncharacterized protein n=1 Tax=Spirosoma profusum TaxID=2771354 RepID=A0A927AQZ4_9BACT|nr:hypothetical protein [Spirosoma profusum]MBD2701456.1 hypothetical protein [Spirosoma profusum]
MNSLFNFLNRIATWKTVLPLLVLYVSFPAYWLKNAEDTINQLAGKRIGPIDLTFGFNPARTLAMIADYGPAARSFYARTELTTDVIYPLVYSTLLSLLLTMLFRNKPNRLFIGLPFFTLLLDYLENAAIVTLLNTYPTQSTGVAVLCEVVKLAKWLSFGVVIGLIGYGLILKAINRTNRMDTVVKDPR